MAVPAGSKRCLCVSSRQSKRVYTAYRRNSGLQCRAQRREVLLGSVGVGSTALVEAGPATATGSASDLPLVRKRKLADGLEVSEVPGLSLWELSVGGFRKCGFGRHLKQSSPVCKAIGGVIEHHDACRSSKGTGNCREGMLETRGTTGRGAAQPSPTWLRSPRPVSPHLTLPTSTAPARA